MTRDDFQSILDNNDVHLRINSVKFEHHVNHMVISDNQPIKGTAVFHKNDGFPIKLDIESFLTISIECRHKVIDEFKIPIRSAIEWKIVNGIEDVVFKHGYGANTRYSDCDNNDCVIYYPPRDGIGKIQKVKEIPIIIKIKANKKSREIIKNLPLDNSIDINSIGLCHYNACSFLLTLYLKQREGFLNKMLYEVSFTVKKITKESKLENYSNLKTITNNNDPSSSFIYSHHFRDNLKVTTLRKSLPKCIYCNLVMTVKQEHKLNPVECKPKINIETDRFFTSEYIKISNNQTCIKDTHVTNECSTLFSIKINQKHHHSYNFRIINCPSVKTAQLLWSCTAGSLPCGENGDSVIFHSPEEKELSKSPVILSLYEQDTSIDSNKDSPCLSDQKKIWLLRRNIMGG